MANKNYWAIALTGGTPGSLDAIAGAGLNDGDGSLVVTPDCIYMYRLDATSGAAESSPEVISPDAGAGDKRWILVGQSVPQGANTGDIIRYNATSGYWESKAEPLEFKQIVLTPLASPLSEVEGSLYYKSADNSVYVAVE